jgi:hypothetical protein
VHRLKSRTLRNHLEHYDERIDDWAEQTEGKRIADWNIGAISDLRKNLPTFQPTEIMRHYDPDTKEFIFRGEVFNLQTLLADVDDIHDLAADRLQAIDPSRVEKQPNEVALELTGEEVKSNRAGSR